MALRGKKCPRAGLRVRHDGGSTGVVTKVKLPEGSKSCASGLVYVKLDKGDVVGLPREALTKTRRVNQSGSLGDIFRVVRKGGGQPPPWAGRLVNVSEGDYLETDGTPLFAHTPHRNAKAIEDLWAQRFMQELKAEDTQVAGLKGLKYQSEQAITLSKVKQMTDNPRDRSMPGKVVRGDLYLGVDARDARGNWEIGPQSRRPALHVRRAPWASPRGWYADGLTTLRLLRLASGKWTRLFQNDERKYLVDDANDQQALSVWLDRVSAAGLLPPVPTEGTYRDNENEFIDSVGFKGLGTLQPQTVTGTVEQKGNGWRIWSSGGQHSFHLWGREPSGQTWNLSIHPLTDRRLNALGEHHNRSGETIEFFTASGLAASDLQSAAGSTLQLNGRVWHGANSREKDGTFDVALSPEQNSAFLVWLDSIQSKGLAGLRGTDAEHATMFEHARHEALQAAHDAKQALENGQCLTAGTLIDDAYVNLGRAQANAYSAEHMSEAAKLHRTIRTIDEPFEKRCVRPEPVSETHQRSMSMMRPGLAGRKGTKR